MVKCEAAEMRIRTSKSEPMGLPQRKWFELSGGWIAHVLNGEVLVF